NMDENTIKQLVKLVQDGKLQTLEQLITLDGSVALQTIRNKHFGRSGDTLLHYAARLGHLDIMAYLIQVVGMDVELYNNDYKRPLHEAASMSHQDCVSYLLQEGARVDSLKKADWTPLMMACTRSNLAVIQDLLRHGADPVLKNKDGWTAFHIACRKGDPLVVDYLLTFAPDIWGIVSGRKRANSAAVSAAEFAFSASLHCSSINSIWRFGAGSSPWTPAREICEANTTIMCPMCEDFEASPTARDRLGAQPLHQASVTGQQKALTFLVRDLNVDVNQRVNGIQLTALHYAAKEGHTSAVKELLELGADLHVRDRKGRSALHMACIGQHAGTAKVLLELGLRDSEDCCGTTAQQLAKKTDVVQVFDHCLK
uniref:Ankyrin repeat domain 16 n=1 Tax=Tetraodon nigroviridis TaxID=99883 RepID=H3C536_TETNG